MLSASWTATDGTEADPAAIPVSVLAFCAPLHHAHCAPLQQAQDSAATAPDHPAYTADGQLQAPMHYREWIYLTTGLDMSYTPQPGAAGHSMFDNVFVNPSSYQFFQRTGTWPDGTTLVLEMRRGETGVSINRHGQTQSAELTQQQAELKKSNESLEKQALELEEKAKQLEEQNASIEVKNREV